MKHCTWIVTLLLALSLFSPLHAGERAMAPPALAGFTPTLQLSLVLREPHFWVGRETTMSATVTLQGPQAQSGQNFAVTVSGPASTSVSLSMSLGAGSTSQNIVVNLPDNSDPATYTATIANHPEATSSDTTRGYGVSIAFAHSQVAIGAAQNAAHQSAFTLTAATPDGPVAGIELDAPSVLSGGLGPNAAITADIDMAEGAATNAQGKIEGTFTSGNRLQSTVIGYRQSQQTFASASIEQVWNALPPSQRWSHDPYFYYDEASTVSYIQYLRQETEFTESKRP